jgi:hypothetical protein
MGNRYNHPAIWHFRFNGPTPEAFVQARERIFFEHFWNNFAADKTRSIPEVDRQAYAAAYARPGRMRAEPRTAARIASAQARNSSTSCFVALGIAAAKKFRPTANDGVGRVSVRALKHGANV